jgi:hypothetical protein
VPPVIARIRGLNWLAGLIAAACVLPISGLFTFSADQSCNHMQARVPVPEPDTPRGAWCNALLWDQHWLILLLVPAAATLLLVLLVGRRPRAYVPAWGCGVFLAFAAITGLTDARAYPLV